MSKTYYMEDGLWGNWNQQLYGVLTSTLLAWKTLADPQWVSKRVLQFLIESVVSIEHLKGPK